MIIVRTPVRLELLGGGTDMNYFCKNYPGKVLNAALNKYIYLTINSNFEKKFKIRYSKNEYVSNSSEVRHTRVKAALEFYGLNKGLEIVSTGEVPAGSGLGSSSSFTVGLVHGLSRILGKNYSCKEIAEIASDLEINKLGEPIGKQDQYAAAFGGFNMMHFNDNDVEVEKVNLNKEIMRNIENHLILIYTGKKRSNRKILCEQKENLDAKIPILSRMAKLAEKGLEVIRKGDLEKFANLLEQEWQIKKKLASGISNRTIEKMYAKAIGYGAWGGRVSGAGGGGFLTLIVPPGKRQEIKNAFSNFIIMEPCFVDSGSQIIFEEQNEF